MVIFGIWIYVSLTGAIKACRWVGLLWVTEAETNSIVRASPTAVPKQLTSSLAAWTSRVVTGIIVGRDSLKQKELESG
jgi:hypothetical protein